MRLVYKITVGVIIIGIGIGIFFGQNFFQQNNNSINMPVPSVSTPGTIKIIEKPLFQIPLDRAIERVTKKPFGIFITPQNSPIQPEKFSGYHTGTDFEIFPEELNVDVPVQAICAGKLVVKKAATGYGGVVVESCELNGETITIVYGHLRLSSIALPVGANLALGETIGVLGRAYSTETSGERKHLHLGIHKGAEMNILGYVQNKSELASWIDPCLYVCR